MSHVHDYLPGPWFNDLVPQYSYFHNFTGEDVVTISSQQLSICLASKSTIQLTAEKVRVRFFEEGNGTEHSIDEKACTLRLKAREGTAWLIG